jgi:hypothetical protein
MNGATLLDSFVTNTTDACPLINISNISAGNTMSRVPGTTGVTLGTGGYSCSTYAWTIATYEAFTNNAASAQDLWASQKIHTARLFVAHTSGRSSSIATTNGYARGLWKSDYLCLDRGGTVQLGDTMTISGNAWTVISNSANIIGGTGSAALIIVTRAT